MVGLSSMAQTEPVLEYAGFTIREYGHNSFNLYFLITLILLTIYPIVFWTSFSIKRSWAQGPKIILELIWISIIIATPMYIISKDIYVFDMINTLTFNGRNGIILILYMLAVTFFLLLPVMLPKDQYNFYRVASISIVLLVLLTLPQMFLFESIIPLIVPLFSVVIVLIIIGMTIAAKIKIYPATE